MLYSEKLLPCSKFAVDCHVARDWCFENVVGCIVVSIYIKVGDLLV